MSAHAEAPAAPAGPKKNLLPMILSLVNVLAVVGALGTLVYTKLLYQRPPITEESERARLTKLNQSPTKPLVAGLIEFEPVTINIATPEPGAGKSHFLTLGFALEIHDMRHQAVVESLRPLILDKLVSVIGRLHAQDLNNVQGRYILRARLIELVNQIIVQSGGRIELPVIAAAAKPGAEGGEHGGGEGGGHGEGGGEGHGEVAKPRAPASTEETPPIPSDLVGNVYFTQFMVQ